MRAFSLCRHAIATTPAGSSQGSGCSLDFDDGGLPQMTAGSAPAVKSFRGLLGVHACYGLSARGVANATLCIEGFGSVVTSTTAPIATGWSNSCQVGIAPTEERRLGTAHGHTSITIVIDVCPHSLERSGRGRQDTPGSGSISRIGLLPPRAASAFRESANRPDAGRGCAGNPPCCA